MHVSFRLDAPGLTGARFLVERDRLTASGDLETAFFDRAGALRRHHDAPAGRIVVALAADPQAEMVVVVRNPRLVLDADLPNRIAAALERLAPINGAWAVAGAGGLTPAGGRVCALYSAETPFLPSVPSPKPLTDPMPDLWIADAGYLRGLTRQGRALPVTGLEAALALQGYLDGRVSVFVPELVAGIDGPLRSRDPVRLTCALRDWFDGAVEEASVETLLGPVTLAAPPRPDRPEQPRPLAEAIERVVRAHCAPLSLSIVTRTRFRRLHLLERLLTSITRARPDDGEIEIVLSTDTEEAVHAPAMDHLRAAFVNLDLRLQVNPAEGHSRVTNLVGGLRAASKTHVAVMDDDDYVDLFAFDEMRPALFLGARPLMVTGAQVHEEDWVETPSGRHQLVNSTERTAYPATGWRDMFGGVNRLPVCAMIAPRDRLLARLDAFEFRHDLSEDYALALTLLTDPDLPEIAEIPGTFGHISLRPTEGQSIAMEDRRPWCRDIALYLSDLTRNARVAGAGTWALLTRGGDVAGTVDRQAIADLQRSLATQERRLRLLAAENARLREGPSDRIHATAPGKEKAA